MPRAVRSTLETTVSIADGLLTLRPGDLTFAHVQAFVDEVVTVTDEEIAAAVKWLFHEAKIVAEPSGAATVAAALRVHEPDTVAVVSGGNVDPDVFAGYIRVSSGSSSPEPKAQSPKPLTICGTARPFASSHGAETMRTLHALGFLVKGPLILAFLFLINLMTSPGHWWVQWPALGIGIAWFFSLIRVIRALVIVGGLAGLAAYLNRQR